MNNEAILVCISHAIIHYFYYVSYIVQILHIESALAILLFGFPILRSCELWMRLPAPVGNVLYLNIVLPRPMLHVGGDIQCLVKPIL